MLLPSSLGQECHDWDADDATAGWDCPAAVDCADRWWARRPGATEACNALDDDCDGIVDESCDLWCEELGHVPVSRELPVEGYSHFRTAHVVRTERGVLVGSGMHEVFDNDLSRLFMRAYDDDGRSWDGAHEMTGESPEPPMHDFYRMASAGDRALVAWIDARPELGDKRLWSRVVDDLGRPVAEAWNLSLPVDDAPSIDGASVVWDGDRFVVFWTSTRGCGRLYMSTFFVDGTPSFPLSKLVAAQAGTQCRPVDNPVAFWTDPYYLVFFRQATEGDGNRVLKVSREGVPIGSAKELAGDGVFLNGIRGNGEIGLAWSHDRKLESEYGFFALVNDNGEIQDPPGVVPLYAENLEEDKWHSYVAWTGEMYFVAVEAFRWAGNDYQWRWILWRVLPDGTVLDSGGFVISDHSTTRRLHDIVWSGDELWVFGSRYKPALNENALHWENVVCSCDDADEDTYDACMMADCDDSRADVNPLAVEVCRGHLDDDCDGSIDCADALDCPGAPGPPAIEDLQWGDGGWTWSPPPGAERYDFARGLVSDVARRGDLLQSECVGIELMGTTWQDDGRRPPAQDALWYLVRPEGEPCALGPWAVDVSRSISACF